MSVNLSFANEDDDVRIKGEVPKVAERYTHQVSSPVHQKQRNRSIEAIEVDSIRTNPFVLKDKNYTKTGEGRQNVKIVKNQKSNYHYGIDNESLSDDLDCVVDNGNLCADIAISRKSPKVITRPSDSVEKFSDFDGNNNNPVKYCRKSSYQFSSELLTWYSGSPSSGKSASLPRKLPPPPASPSTRHRLPSSPAVRDSVTRKGRASNQNSSLVHTVKKSSAAKGCRAAIASPSNIRRHSKNSSFLEERGITRSAPQSPNKSATLPPSHRLSPHRGTEHSLQHSVGISTPSSRPPSPQSNVRRCVSLLSSPSLLKKSPTLPKKKSGSYKNLGINETLRGEEVKVQGSNSNASLNKLKQSNGLKKKSQWRPVDSTTMTNYEGYYPDESSDGEAIEVSTMQREKHQKSFDSVVFHVLKVLPEDFASQLTILDLDAFREIQPQELTGCEWIKKNKAKTSPNVVQMTQRFNNTSFYVVHEILHAQTLKIRAEIVTHFIKIAKKLFDLNNIHSLMAIISSLNSCPIHRLAKTWALVNKHHRAMFDRLRCLVSEENNRKNLRKHIAGIKLPCIPYLGLYLADLIYVDSAHPDTGGLESHERTNKMNNILRILAEFQQSIYELREITHIKSFLQSVKYIEELQRFAEEENYKRSLKIEPNQPTTPLKLGASREELRVPGSYDHTLPRQAMTPPNQQLFKLGHRKTHSLGRDLRPKTDPVKLHKSGSLPRNTQPPQPQHLSVKMTTSLLDDSIISPGAPRNALNNGESIGSSRSNSGSEFSDDTSWNGISVSDSKKDLGRILFEGILKRKTVLKRGRKPTMSYWTQYWVCVYKSLLVFHAAKAMKAFDRHHFKQSPCKMITVREWMVLRSDDSSKLDSFQLSNPYQGDIYRFQCDSTDVAMVWVNTIQEAIKGNSPMLKEEEEKKIPAPPAAHKKQSKKEHPAGKYFDCDVGAESSVSSESESEQDSGTESSVGSEVEFHEYKPAASPRHRPVSALLLSRLSLRHRKRRHKKLRKSRTGSSSNSDSDMFELAGGRLLEGETTNTLHLATQTSTSREIIDEVDTTFGNLAVGTRPVKTTSTKDSSTQTRTSMENAATQTDEVVTTFGNLDGGLAISKSIHKVIGSEPEQLNVGGCLADFPPHSFSESTPVNVTAELNTSKWSKKFILFTPSLYVDANGLQAKIRVRLPSWYVNNRQQKIEARILHLPKNADDWEDTGMTLPVTSMPFFDFDWQDFSAVAVGDDKDSSNLQVLSQRIAGSVYISDENEVSIVFHNNDKATPTSESMALVAVKERMALTRPPKHLKIHLNQFTAKLGDNIEAHIECDVPSDLTFKPKEPFLFEVDEDFVEELFVEYHGVVSGSLEQEQRIEMYCTVHKVSGNKRKMIRCPSFFACRWIPRNFGEKQKQSEKVSGQAVPPVVKFNVSVNADQSKHTETENIDNRGHHVTANKYFGAKANVTLSETDTSATVLNKVPANQN